MKKFLAFLLAAVMATALLAGCGAQKGGTVATDGSTSMEKVINALGESFMQNNSGTTFTYNPTGSGSGIQAVSEGRCDIGLASRSLKDDEKAGGLQETVLAYDGIAIIVSPENPVSDLSVEQIAKIYTGEITNWKDVGGNDADIVLIGREAGSGTRDGFESITDTKDKCQYRQELTSTGDVITAVSQNPQRHRLCIPLRRQGQREGPDRRRRGPDRGHREGRQLRRAASLRPRDQGRYEALRHGAEVLRLRDLCGRGVHHQPGRCRGGKVTGNRITGRSGSTRPLPALSGE